MTSALPLSPEQEEIHKLVAEHVLNQANIPVSYHMQNPVSPFVGRIAELSEIKWSHVDKKMVVITGPRGVGKSELAKKYAQDFRADNQSSTIWVNSESHLSFRDDFKDLSINIGQKLENKDATTIVTSVLEHFNNRKTLFIFDNAASDNLFVNNLKNWIGKSRFISILVTSRDEDWVDFLQIKLSHFTKEESKEYIKTALQKDVKMEVSDEECEALSELLVNLPLALSKAVEDIVKKNVLSPEKIYTISDYIRSFQEPVVHTITEVRQPSPEELEDAVSKKLDEEIKRVGDSVTDGAKRLAHSLKNEGRRVEDRVRKWFG